MGRIRANSPVVRRLVGGIRQLGIAPRLGFVEHITANPCSTVPWVLLSTLLAATPFILARIALFDLDDLIVDNSRKAGRRLAGANRRGHRDKKQPKGWQKIEPKFRAGATKFAFLLPTAVQTAGFTYLLMNFNDDFSYTWGSIVMRCPECDEAFVPAALGPFEANGDQGGRFIGNVYEDMGFPQVIQNRTEDAPLGSQIFWDGIRLTLPFGDWDVAVFGQMALETGSVDSPREVEFEISIVKTIQGFPVPVPSTDETFTFPIDTPTGFMVDTTIHVPPFVTAEVRFRWRVKDFIINGFVDVEKTLFVTGQATCSSGGPVINL